MRDHITRCDYWRRSTLLIQHFCFNSDSSSKIPTRICSSSGVVIIGECSVSWNGLSMWLGCCLVCDFCLNTWDSRTKPFGRNGIYYLASVQLVQNFLLWIGLVGLTWLRWFGTEFGFGVCQLSCNRRLIDVWGRWPERGREMIYKQRFLMLTDCYRATRRGKTCETLRHAWSWIYDMFGAPRSLRAHLKKMGIASDGLCRFKEFNIENNLQEIEILGVSLQKTMSKLRKTSLGNDVCYTQRSL